MKLELIEHVISCPFCAESISVLLDPSGGDQSYIEDCQVCCRPIEISFELSGDDAVNVSADCAS